MKLILFIIIFLQTIFGFSQNQIESLIKKVSSDIITNNKKYYLVEESYYHKIAFDSLDIKNSSNLLLRHISKIPNELISRVENKYIDWKKFNLNNVKYITLEDANRVLHNTYDVFLVEKNISNDSLYFLNANKDINTLILKKTRRWNEKKFWCEIEKFRDNSKILNLESKNCYSFSNPIFSSDNKFARISVFEFKACRGNCKTYIYKFENNEWEYFEEFNQFETVLSKTHVSCEQIGVNLLNFKL